MAVKPVPEALGVEDIIRIGDSYQESQAKALFYFLYLTGCRITEALNVRAKDVTLETLPEVGDILRVHLLTLKNKLHKVRDIPVVISDKEKPMVDYVVWYLGQRQGEIYDPDIKVFTFSRQNAWNKLASKQITMRATHGKELIEDYTFKIRPHYLRHCRATHLVNYFGFDDTKLVRYFGWTNSKPAQTYVKLNWMDLARAMKGGV
jgi:integrase